MRHFDIARKTTSILANLSLLLNSFLPFVLAIQPVNAQSVEDLSPTPTPAEIVENSPTPTPEIVISETPAPSPEITPEITPEVTPEITPIDSPEPTAAAVEATPTIEPTVTPENNQPQQPQNNNDNQNNNSPEVTPTVLPTVTPTPTPNPVVKEVEQTCFSESDQIRNSVELDWNYDATNDLYETREKVQLGVKYIFPQDNKVTVTFSCLPKEELLRSTLKIKRVKTSDLKLPTIENIGDYAYDITTGMRDGSFKYDITLPKLSDSTAKVSYIKKSLEEAKLVAVSESEVKSIDNLEQQSDLVKATNIDHFTIYIVNTYLDSFLTTTKTSYVQGETVYAKGTSSNERNIRLVFFDKNNNVVQTCPGVTGTQTTCEYALANNATLGSWSVQLQRNNSGWEEQDTTTFTVTAPVITPPTLPNNPSDTYALNSVTGSWTAISGGSGYQGINTSEIRWGNPSGDQKSGLRFINSGAQSFNSGNTFYLGMLTHMNWGTYAGTAADGATLQITLNFNRPNIPNPVFTYDFDIEETSNSTGSCRPYQISNTPCDDKITFPVSYGTQVVTIGDIQYTLVIDGFVNAYPSGTAVPAFITEEQRENSAFLVGHLSSVLVERPAISIIKTTNDQDITSAPGPYLSTDNTVNWKYNIQNIGNVDLTNVTVVDNPAVSINCNGQTTLASGAQMTCTANGAVTVGQFSNTATVTGTHSTGTVTASDTSWYFGTRCGDGKIEGSEQCDGGACCDNTCHFASSGSVCRAASGSCDNAEVCSGTSATCPTDSFKPAGASCSDGSFCNGNEQCNGSGSCLSGNVVDCSVNNITGINSCDNNPDNNPFTKDTRNSFNSVCSEATQSCTLGDSTIFHQVPTVGTCGVECNTDSNCLSSEKVCNFASHKCVSSCGNDIKESWEECDGTKGVGEHQECNDQCKLVNLSYCGDGTKDVGETCDDGANNGKYGFCNLTCNGRSLHCGDDIVTPPEECDGSEPASCLTDSGYFGTKSCDNLTCGWGNCLTTQKCGDGVRNGLETCDDGANNGQYGYCNSTCTAMGEFCGDKTINGSEECDGSAPSHYNCTGQCKLEYIPYCGDNLKNQEDEECDGSAPEHYSCTNQCKLQYVPYCGDGIKNTSSEFCDGNDLNGLPSSDFSCNKKCELDLVEPKVTICHSNNSQTNPYISEEPNKSADVSGHDNHNGVVWYPGIADHSWGDIIPPFAYIGGTYPGQNWTTEGQTIYDNGCQYPSGSINVVKVISNDATNYSDFSFSVNSESPVNFENDGSNQIDAKVGVTYNITEVPVSGYEVSYDGCKNVSITKGETKTCTITNTKHAKLTVIKQVDTNNDGVIENSNATDWTWDIKNGDQNIATGQTKELAAGSYTISEDQKDAYRLKQWTCSNETRGTTNSIGVTLNPGDDITCTITNTRKTGNIRVCKVVLDGNGNIVDGSVLPNNTFSLAGLNQITSQGAPTGVIGTTTFVTPLSYSEKLFGSEVNNAICTTYENLIPGNYYYGPESLPEEFWGIPKYNDGSVSQNSLTDHFYEYSGQLFDADTTNDDQRQTSSDGHIVLGADQTRTIIVLNQYQYAKLNVTKFNDFDGDGYQDPDETNLSDWTINLTNQPSAVTNSNGLVTFTNIAPTNYTLSETQKDGWMQTNIICDGQEGIDNDNAHQISLTAGQTLNCKIGNRQLGKVTVYKFNDLNGNGQKDEGESNLSNWQINLTNQTSLNTNESGQVIFNNLVPGNYDLSENVQSENGWKQTNIYCEDSGNGVKITAPGYAYGHHGNCSGWNQCGDARTCALKACQANGYQNLVSYGDQKPCTQFTNCSLFYNINYDLSYQAKWGNWCDVMGVTDIVCSNGSGSGDYYNNGYVSGSHLIVNPGQNKICYIGNQRLEPKTTITKSNNSGGVELSPGSSVEYTINVGFSDNSVNNLKVTDLLSNGFKYKLGSYKVYKTTGSITEDVTNQVNEPQYHSPGIWDLSALGKLSPEDQIKLVYTADISTDQQAGKYADLAWSIANYAYDSNKTVLALAGSEGHVDTNFVGTQVAVGGNYQNSVSAEVKQENHVTGQVLGASTELPGTGAATIWLIISGFLGLLGFSFLKFNKKTMLTILLTLLSFGLVISPVRAETSSLSVRLEEPKTPSRIKEIELKYVALDIQGRGITAYCLKKGPTDSDFVEFSSETLSGANGNASHCSLASAITDNGSYQFQVKAIAGGEESFSNTVSLDYNTSSPGTPIDYRKEQINSCDFKIHFKTADDSGKTVKVELYRSTDSNFSANNESLVVSTDIGSNQEKDVYNSVSDCSKTYYYALRAFDSAGNGSGLVGDKVYTTITDGDTTTTSTTTTNSGAIPISGTVIPKEGEGDQVNPNTIEQDGTGQVLGTRTVVKDFFFRHPITTILIAVLILGIIIYAFKKIRQGKKIVVKKRK